MALDFPVGTDFPANGNQIPDGHQYDGFYWDSSAGVWKRICEEDRIGDCLEEDETVCDRLVSVENGIIELEEEFENLLPSLDRGAWRYNEDFTKPPGKFGLRTSGGGLPTAWDQVAKIIIHKTDDAGEAHGFGDIAVDSYIQLFQDGESDTAIYQVAAEPVANGDEFEIEVGFIREAGDNYPALEELFRFKFYEIVGGDAGAYVLKSGDTMTGNLTIDKSEGGPTSGGTAGKEAALTLKGDRTGTTDAVATIKFDNAASSYPGYLTYRSGTSSTQFFKFSQNVDFSNKDLSAINTISIRSDLTREGSKRITFQSGGGNTGNGTIIAHRPTDLKRGFTIKGKQKGSNSVTGDVFYHYTNSGSGGDSVDYTGICTSGNHIMNRDHGDERFVQTGTKGIKITKSNGNYYIQG